MNDDLKFDEWNTKKKEISKKAKKKNINVGSIYWVNIGQNLGGEIFGKGSNFKRPVLVLSKIIKYNSIMFLGVPLSSKTKNKSGFHFYHFIDNQNTKQVALLGQIRIFDTKRIVSYLSRTSKENLNAIKEQIAKRILELEYPST